MQIPIFGFNYCVFERLHPKSIIYSHPILQVVWKGGQFGVRVFVTQTRFRFLADFRLWSPCFQCINSKFHIELKKIYSLADKTENRNRISDFGELMLTTGLMWCLGT